MKSIEQMKAEQARELAKLEREHAVANALPIPPDSVLAMGKRAPWVGYKVASVREALAIFATYAERFGIVNMEHAKGTFTHVYPASERDARERVEHLGDYCIGMRVHEGEGFMSAEVFFYAAMPAEHGGGLVKVRATLPDNVHALRAHVDERRDARTDRLTERKLTPNHALHGMADKSISYGTGDYGPIKRGADITYLFVADDGEACTEHSHAQAQLVNVAENLKV
jgi:hypothetical protein